jgi:UDP-N-acetyl-2-amino-2-deoxyglucuronate dehydrogenase
MSHITQFGFGIIGTGLVADYHAQAIRETPGAHLIGAADLMEDRVRRFAEKHGAGYWTTRFENLVARPDIHVICITTPSGAHLEPALAAIHAGKHLVVEKPLEVTLERVDTLLHAAELAGIRVAAIFQNRFGAGAQAVKAAFDKDRFGRLVLASAYVKWHRPREYYRDNWHGSLKLDGGGALMNQAIHAVDLLQWFVGMPAEVCGWTTRCVHTGIEVEDTATAMLRFPGGALGSIEASTALFPGWARRLELCGEHGSVILEDDQVTRWEFRDQLPGDDIVTSAGAAERTRSGAGSPQISYKGHLLQIQDMVAALRNDRAPAVDGRAGRNAVALIRAIYESANAGMSVKLAS